jgi:hypothetical protein
MTDLILGARIDAGDNLLARPLPIGGRVAQRGNVFVGTLGMRLGDTRHLNVCHTYSFRQYPLQPSVLKDLG